MRQKLETVVYRNLKNGLKGDMGDVSRQHLHSQAVTGAFIREYFEWIVRSHYNTKIARLLIY